MSTAAEPTDVDGDGPKDGSYECHICFEQARDAVVSMCGHLFCWPCIHRWMESRPNNPTCPVCKSVIQKDKLIPLYGRGTSDKEDPRDKVPPRPAGQREEPQQANNGAGLDGINISFGIGAFPFTLLGGPVFQGGMNFPPQQPNGNQPEQNRVARFFLILATLVILLIIFS